MLEKNGGGADVTGWLTLKCPCYWCMFVGSKCLNKELCNYLFVYVVACVYVDTWTFKGRFEFVSARMVVRNKYQRGGRCKMGYRKESVREWVHGSWCQDHSFRASLGWEIFEGRLAWEYEGDVRVTI